VVVAVVENVLGGGDLAGWRVLVSAGGTREPVDPVRYLGNRSTGKMGNAVALAAAQRGAEVTLVTTQPGVVHPSVEVIGVDTADEMAASVWKLAAESDVVVLTAAVADFRPAEPAPRKVRRAEGLDSIELEPTPDILAGVAALEQRPFLVGFAAETGSIDGAVEKARNKGVDLLVANDVTKSGSGFGTDTNEVALISPDGAIDEWPQASKAEIAGRLWDVIRDRREGVSS
jgi:phosphopantothenoylcysteine decarboxylase/phosphopantothenate--cysteine ligase